MACPTIPYGIPASGATELNFNSGRELFRCGVGTGACVKMYVTNVTLESSTVYVLCGSISDDAQIGEVCMQSAQLNWRDQSVVNWEAKNGVTTNTPVGSVITLAKACAGGDYSIYTHSEGQLSARVLAHVDQLKLDSTRENVRDRILAKNETVGGDLIANGADMDWILSDIGTNVSATDWQGGSINYNGFGSRTEGGDKTYRFSFNWQNGRAEKADGVMTYDTSVDPSLMNNVVDLMLA